MTEQRYVIGVRVKIEYTSGPGDGALVGTDVVLSEIPSQDCYKEMVADVVSSYPCPLPIERIVPLPMFWDKVKQGETDDNARFRMKMRRRAENCRLLRRTNLADEIERYYWPRDNLQ